MQAFFQKDAYLTLFSFPRMYNSQCCGSGSGIRFSNFSGPGSGFQISLDPDPVCRERLDADPENSRPDPKPCLELRMCYLYSVSHNPCPFNWGNCTDLAIDICDICKSSCSLKVNLFFKDILKTHLRSTSPSTTCGVTDCPASSSRRSPSRGTRTSHKSGHMHC